MWPRKNSSALIGGKFNLKKKPLQDLLSGVNAVISTNERIEFITGHVIFNRNWKPPKLLLECSQILQYESHKINSFWQFWLRNHIDKKTSPVSLQI